MADLTPDQKFDNLFNQLTALPEDKQKLVISNLSPDMQKAIGVELKSRLLQMKPSGKEEMGTYEMVNPIGRKVQIPFDNVMEAGKSGFQISQNDFPRFTKDYTATLPTTQRIDQFLSPEDETSWAKRGLNIFKGGAAGIVNPFLHPVQTARSQGEMYLTTGVGGAPGFPALPPIPRDEQVDKQVVSAAQNEAVKQGNEAAQHPFYTAASAIAPAVASHVLAEYGPKLPGVRSVNDLIEKAPESIRGKLRNKFGGGEAFTEKKAAKFHGDTELARAKIKAADEVTEAKRGGVDDVNEERHAAYQERLGKHGEKVEKQRQKFDEKTAKWEKNKAKALKQHQDDVKAVQEENAKALKDHIAEVERINKENEAGRAIIDARAGIEKQIADDSANMRTRIQKAEADAKRADDAAWDAWRSKVGNAQVDMKPVTDTIEDQEKSMNPQSVSEFRDILNAAKESGSSADILNKTSQQTFGRDYKNLTDQEKAGIDQYLAQRGINVSQGSASDTPISRLHGWKTELERAVRTAKDGNVRYAIGKVLQSVRKLEEDVSAQANAGAELEKARELHGPYVDTFVNPPGEPATVATAYERSVNPEFASDKHLEEMGKKLGAYDPEIPKIGEKIVKSRDQLKSMKSESAARGMLKPVPAPPKPKPLPPEPEIEPPPTPPDYKKAPNAPSKKPYPEPESRPTIPTGEDWTPERARELKANIEKYGSMGSWVARLILGGVGESLAAFLTNGPARGLGELSSGILIGWGGLRLLSNMLKSDNFLDWMAKPSEADIEIINSLPPDEAARLRIAMGILEQDAIRKHPESARNFKMSPAIATFLGVSGASTQNHRQDHQPIPPGVTHVYDPETGTINAIQQ